MQPQRKKWCDAEDDLLLQLEARQINRARIASRFGCSELEIETRLKELKQKAASGQPVTEAAERRERVEALKPQLQQLCEGMNAMQVTFMQLCFHYNQVGEQLKVLSEMVSSIYAPEELEKVLAEIMATARHPNENTVQKIARALTERCIVIPRPQLRMQIDNTNPQQG